MYISEDTLDTIILLIVIIGFLIFGFVMSSNRAVAWQNSKSFDDFVLFCEFIAVLLLVALVIYLIFFKEW